MTQTSFATRFRQLNHVESISLPFRGPLRAYDPTNDISQLCLRIHTSRRRAGGDGVTIHCELIIWTCFEMQESSWQKKDATWCYKTLSLPHRRWMYNGMGWSLDGLTRSLEMVHDFSNRRNLSFFEIQLQRSIKLCTSFLWMESAVCIS